MGNTPNIRFKGFTDDWEQRKFKDVFDGLQNNTFSRADLNYESGAVKNVHYGDVLIKFGDFIDVSKDELPFITDESQTTKYNSSFLQDGDIIIADTAEDSTVGKCSEIVGFQGVKLLSGLHTIPCRPKEKYAPKFMGYYINSDAYHKQLIPLMQGIKVTSISKSALQETDMILPKSFEEQAQIGEYFSNIDHLITLHQRKCDEMKKMKKFMLQKMFPKNGQKNPEIRFDGFTDDWEQRKLGEVVEKVTTKNNDTQYIETFTNSAELGIMSQREYFDHDVSNIENISGYYIVENDAFVYNPRISTSAPVGPINRNKLGRTGVMSPLYTVFKVNGIDSEYLEWYFKSTGWHSFMKFNGDSGARSDRFSIKDSVFFEMPIPTPDIDEQEKIGEYFSSLDHLITLHQRKVENLKNLKKYMLQNMFV
ncbi:restriction endonuclease subunit S [Roseburia intestinalis]|uniref:restriction endonuclease subunit S n=1 Tax=Roseburia intestinalis TaxID=166486 RepID=UPI0035200ED4